MYLPDIDLSMMHHSVLGWGQTTIARGFRSSSATGYLAHTNDNVHVLLNTRVTRILPVDDHSPKAKDFRKIELAATPEGPSFFLAIACYHSRQMTGSRQTLTAKKELILSCGVINTPQIMLNSGIGPKDELQALGIQTLVDNPSVGKNFSDQVSISIGFATNLAVTECVLHHA